VNIREVIATINQMQADGVIAKDKARLLQFIEAGALDAARFQAIVARHGLVSAWQRFEQQFLSDAP
jgi:hypothetical protein